MFESEIESFYIERENVHKFTMVAFCLTVSILMKHFILIFTEHKIKVLIINFPYAIITSKMIINNIINQ